QVITRLVKHQDVGVCQRETGKGNTRLLTTGQELHLLKAGHARDAKGAEVAAVLLIGLARILGRHEADGRHGEVEGIDVMLSEEADSETRVLGDDTLGGG